MESEPGDGPASEPETVSPSTDTAGVDPSSYTPRKADWSLKIKEKGKQCYGSAGCNLDVRVTPVFVGDGKTVPDEGTMEITYALTGDESGKITGTLEVDLSTTETELGEESLSTRSNSVKVKGTITDVEYREW